MVGRIYFNILMIIVVLFIIVHGTEAVGAHEENQEENPKTILSELLESILFPVLGVASILVFIFVILAMAIKKPTKAFKLISFLGIAVPIVIASVFLMGSTIYKESISVTKGPVHWHADFEIWDCEEEIKLRDPEGLLNRIGTSLFHEHADNRVHIEGTVLDLRKADLDSFFEVIGGSLTKDKLVAPTNDGLFSRQNGDLCGNNPSEWQVFAYRTIDGVSIQEKLEDYPNYVISSESIVPPGDCIIFEFGPKKDKTEHICVTYRVAIEQGALIGS